jgi:glutathione synthase/RimK-type ligase-like ATP-grasp enzyme
MTREIIILSGPDDPHAFAVAEGVRRKGGDVTIWYTSDFPASSWESLEFEDDRLRLDIRGPHQTISQPAPATVWNRRLSKSLDVSALHPADRLFGHAQCFDLRRSMVHLLGRDALWINSPLAQSRAILKPVQMRVAQESGFDVPRTLYSNDPERIRTFIRRMGGTVVFKQLALVGVWSDGDKRFAPYTTTVREDQLADDLRTAAAPGIFQEILPRAYELRVTVMGDRMFVTRLDPPAAEDAKVDWRLAVLRGQTEQMKPASIPPSVEQSVRAYMRNMNLVFGCFDLFVTPEGRHVFIECNEAGQFLFVEQETGEAVLDAFVAFVMQGTPHFEWRETPESLRLSDIWKIAQQQSEEAQKLHTVGAPTRFYEGAPATESV